jgi:DNA-binding NarL/FixJ family response regulator
VPGPLVRNTLTCSLTGARIAGEAIVKILLVDDHELLRGGLILSLRHVCPEAVCAEAGTLSEAKAILASQADVELVLTDLHLPDSDGVRTLIDLRAWCEARGRLPRFVVLSATEDPAVVREVIQEHATGFIPKSVPEKIFANAVRLTIDGGVYIPELLCRALAPAPGAVVPGAESEGSQRRKDAKLTGRETGIAALLVRGLTYKQIARELSKQDGKVISELTVRTHVSNMAWKMGVQSGGKLGVMAEISRRGLKFP